jgi:sterol desaturase/sphingolipid hydroxylase (fatty acid hydroxylase superfamily)
MVPVSTPEVNALRDDIVALRKDLQRLTGFVHEKCPEDKPTALQVQIKVLWEKLRKRVGDTDLVIGGTASIHTVVFWGFGLTMLALDSRLQKWKLQPGRSPTTEMYKRLFIGLAKNHLVLLVLSGVARKLKFVQDHCRELCEQPIPSLRRTFLEVCFHFLVNDIVFYFAHGLLHTPYFYKRIHKIHHLFKAPIALAAEYSHPVEYVLSNIVPGAIGPAILRSHPLVAWLWLCIGVGMTSFHHGGYVIPYYPFNEWALLHDYHHYSFYSNLGVTGLLDKVLGTSGGLDYTNWRREIIKRTRIVNSFLFWKHPISSALQVW